MDITVSDVRGLSRYEARAGEQLAAFAEYVRAPDTVTFTHTEVRDGFDGHGVASTLIRGALDDVRAQGLAVIPVCPFVRGFLDQHRAEYGGLVAGSTPSPE